MVKSMKIENHYWKSLVIFNVVYLILVSIFVCVLALAVYEAAQCMCVLVGTGNLFCRACGLILNQFLYKI